MKVTKRTYYKALFLLIVFSLNTAVSFACSVSDLFHGMHHHSTSATATHEHGSGKKHVHEHNSNHHDAASKEEKGKHDCCAAAVTKVQLVEKSVSRLIDAPKVVFVTFFLFTYTVISHNLLQSEQSFAPNFIRWRLPATIPDLRIVIQSFQI